MQQLISHRLWVWPLALLGLLGASPAAVASAPQASATFHAEAQTLRLTRQLIHLEGEAWVVARALSAGKEAQIEHFLQRSAQEMTTDPERAAALLALVADLDNTQGPQQAHWLLESGRVSATIGAPEHAARQFIAASKRAKSSHQLWIAVESFVQIAPALHAITDLPDMQAYGALIHAQDTTDVGHEYLYALGKRLAIDGDQRGDVVLSAVGAQSAAARRALYVRGSLALQRHAMDAAIDLFGRAAHMASTKDAAKRDSQVQTLAWMALGRIHAEQGHLWESLYAFQQVSIDSPLFLEAFLELGWVALDAGLEEMAAAAFAPLSSQSHHSALGRTAHLLEGYLLVRQGDLEAAHLHYQKMIDDGTDNMGHFEDALKNVTDLRDLARDCQSRQRALKNAHLQPLMGRPEVALAIAFGGQISTIEGLGTDLEHEQRLWQRALQQGSDTNPLTALARNQQRVERLLEQSRALARKLRKIPSRARWQSQVGGALADSGTNEPCCAEPSQRLQTLQQRLEDLAANLQLTRRRIAGELMELAATQTALVQQQQAIQQSLAATVPNVQRQLLQQAASHTKQGLLNYVLEGESGILEVVWRDKEEHRQLIADAEQRRQQALDQLYEELADGQPQ